MKLHTTSPNGHFMRDLKQTKQTNKKLDNDIFSQQLHEEIPFSVRMTPPSLIRLTHVQSSNQIARSGDKRSGKKKKTKIKKKGR